MSRGNRKGIIFDDDDDRRAFLEIVAEASERYRVRCLSYCLMGNHYHAVVSTVDRNLSDAMHFVNGVFSQGSNLRHGRTGHLLEGRFRSVLIDNDVYLWNANLYVVMNPVAAGLVAHPSQWPWSSFRATAGIEPPLPMLNLDWLDWALGGQDRDEAQRRYRKLMAVPAGIGFAEAGPAFGGPGVRDLARQEVGMHWHQLRVPVTYKALARPTLASIFDHGTTIPERNERVVRAHVVYGYRLAEIAESLRLHPNTLSRIFRRLKRRSG